MSAIEPTLQPRSGEVELVAFLGDVWGLKWLLAGVIAIAVGVALAIALTATHIYRADAVVAVARNSMSGSNPLGSQLGSLGSLAGFGLNEAGPAQEYRAILRSRALAEAFVEQYDVGIGAEGAADESSSLWQRVRDFRDLNLRIAENPTDGTTTVSIEWPDPDVAATWANAYIALANETIRNRELRTANSNIEYLKQQLAGTSIVGLEQALSSLLEVEIQKQMLAKLSTEFAFTVVDAAVPPEKRTRPRRALIVILGGILGGVAGLLLVFLIRLFRQVRAYH